MNNVNRLKNLAVIASLYTAQVALFWTFLEKFTGTPEWLVKMLSSSPFAGLTGFGWGIIGVLELLAMVFIVLSIIKTEFLVKNDLLWLKSSIAVGMVALAVMAMGSSFASQYDSKANFIYYLGASAIMLLVAEYYSRNEAE